MFISSKFKNTFPKQLGVKGNYSDQINFGLNFFLKMG